MSRRTHGYLFSLTMVCMVLWSVCGCGIENPRTTADKANEVSVTIEAGKTLGTISKYLTGFNIIYSEMPHDVMVTEPEIVPAALSSVDAGVLRFPGGEVINYYHYFSPNYRPYKDIWQTNPDSGDYATPADLDSKVMDVNEFLAVCKEIKAEPILGINIESGLLFDRLDDSLKEAVDIVKYCNVINNYNVKYWYLSNEPYGTNSRYPMTVGEYATQIKAFSKAMKAVDPNIEIIVNWNNRLSEPKYWAQWEYLLEQAGSYFDIADVHWYWDNGTADWDNWLSESPMKSRSWCEDCKGPDNRYAGPTYVEEIRRFRKKLAASGHNIKLAALEWNIGSTSETQPTPFQCALMQSEMLGQFIEGGLDMAAMWPFYWLSTQQSRSFMNNQTNRIGPAYEAFAMYNNVFGQQLVSSRTNRANVRLLSALSQDGKTLWVLLLHKSGEGQSITTKVNVKGFAPSNGWAVTFNAPNLAAKSAFVKGLKMDLDQKAKECRTILPPHSLTMITLKKAQ